MAKAKNDGGTAAKSGDLDLTPLLIDVSTSDIDRVRTDLLGRLRRNLTEWGFSNYEPGHIAGMVGDIRALDLLAAMRSAAPPPPRRLTIDEERAERRRRSGE